MSEFLLNKEQLLAYDQLRRFFEPTCRSNFLLSGYPGTGKTFTLSLVLKELAPSKYEFAIAAFTHKAKRVVQEYLTENELDYDVYTISSLLGLSADIDDSGKKEFSKQSSKAPIFNYRYIWVDECSMIGTDYFKALIGKPVRYIFTGDEFQLPPVNENAFPVFDFFRRNGQPHVNLHEPVRYSGPIKDAVYAALACVQNRELFWPEDHLAYTDDCTFIGDWFADWKLNMQDSVVLTYTNDHVDLINERCREYVYGIDAPPYIEGERLLTYAPINDFEGSPMITNGTEVIVESYSPKRIIGQSCSFSGYDVKLAGYPEAVQVVAKESATEYQAYVDSIGALAKHKECRWSDYYAAKELSAQIKPVYGQTIHKSQGSGYKGVYVVNSFRWLRDRDIQPRLHYVAMSRAKQFLKVSSRP